MALAKPSTKMLPARKPQDYPLWWIMYTSTIPYCNHNLLFHQTTVLHQTRFSHHYSHDTWG